MALAIRMARKGRKQRPFYRIVVTDSRNPRDGRFIETLGSYNPLNDTENRVAFKQERVQYWLDQGAKPSDRVARMLSKAGLAEAPEIHESPKKSAPKAKAQERMKEKEEKLKAQQEAEEAAKAEAAEAETEAPAEEAPAEEQKAEEAPAEEAQAEEAKTEEPKAEEETPAEEKQAGGEKAEGEETEKDTKKEG